MTYRDEGPRNQEKQGPGPATSKPATKTVRLYVWPIGSSTKRWFSLALSKLAKACTSGVVARAFPPRARGMQSAPCSGTASRACALAIRSCGHVLLNAKLLLLRLHALYAAHHIPTEIA
eukprot:279557-Amphidinium_carterae.1